MSNEYQTSDFYTATYLLASGIKLLRVDKSDPRRAIFIFIDTKKRSALLEDFLFGRAKIDPRKFISGIKELKRLLYSDLC